MDPATFFKAFGIFFLIGAFLMGIGYWMIMIFKKSFPNFKFWWKYSVLKKKYDEEEIKQLLEYSDQGMKKEEVMKLLLLNHIPLSKVEDLGYIYEQIKQKEVKII